MSRVILVHGWGGSPNNDWFAWAANKLKQKGYEVLVPSMPDSGHPRMETWIPRLAETIGEPKSDDILIGHSVGCQTILRYLASLNANQRVNKVILVAPWGAALSNLSADEEVEIARPWRETPIDFGKAKTKADSFVAIFSDDDYYVPFEENSRVFKEKLGAEIVKQRGYKHFSEGDGVTELPILLNYL